MQYGGGGVPLAQRLLSDDAARHAQAKGIPHKTMPRTLSSIRELTHREEENDSPARASRRRLTLLSGSHDSKSSGGEEQSGEWWTHEMSYSSLASDDAGYTSQPWLPDDHSHHCMQCGQRFELWRWTHHCRDCGGVFCKECSSHRVSSASLGLDGEGTKTLSVRVCDRCAFSPAHKEHLGCERPFECERCQPPRNPSELVVYLQLGVRLVACCAVCSPWRWRPQRTAADISTASSVTSFGSRAASNGSDHIR